MYYQGKLYALAAVCSIALLTACSSGSGAGSSPGPQPSALVATPADKLTLTRPGSCDAVRSYVSEAIAELILNSNAYPICIDCALTAAGAALPQPAIADSAAFETVTGTNTQESGVDELDIVEADLAGNFYILDGQHLVVSNGLPPANLRELANLELTDTGFAEGLLLDEANQRLVVVLSAQSLFFPAALSLVAPDIWNPGVELLFIDVADPSNPVIDRRLLIDGFKVAVRRVGNRLHLVSHFTPVMPLDLINNTELLDLQQQHADAIRDDSALVADLARRIRDAVTTLINATEPEDYLPSVSVMDGSQPYVPVPDPNCGDVAIPDVPVEFALTSVTSVDSDGSNIATLKVANNAWNVYASNENLYLMQTSGGWWWDRRQMQQTAIYKIAIGAGAPEYRAHGLVDGWASNSYQFSEYEDHLRVATTRSERDPASNVLLQDNNLFILGDDAAGHLNVVGAVEGFGKDERIFSTRYLGDRGYVVTFRQIDPLFTFDLADPLNPRLMGEVEIPGVSTYLHPLDTNHLLTIGIAGDDTGLNGDISLQIFDVQDLANPRLVHSLQPQFDAAGFTWTQALYDPHAFNFFAEANVLTIPVQYWANLLDDHFSGFAAFSVSAADGFTELGRLDHSDLARTTYCPPPATGTTAPICDDGSYLEAATAQRSVGALFGGEAYLYTFSDVGVKVSPVQDFENPVAVLSLPYSNRYWWW